MPEPPPFFVVQPEEPPLVCSGSCHCGQVFLTVTVPQLARREQPNDYQVTYCNRTLCIKQGWLLAYAPQPNAKILLQRRGAQGAAYRLRQSG